MAVVDFINAMTGCSVSIVNKGICDNQQQVGVAELMWAL
jgi:electron transfer flavoprotein alpha subunit